ILERCNAVGAVWRRHYDRLHLHTDRARSGLPGLAIPKVYGRYPSRAHVVVVATGLADYPHAPTWRGMETFDGPILHSSSYRDRAPFTGKRVLVVGFGASGG